MGRKLKAKKPTLAESRSAIVFGVGMLIAFAGMAYALFHFHPPASTQPDATQVPIYFKRAEEAMPFPATLDPAQFQIPGIKEAYSVAKEIPDVLAQQPCYCYCQRIGHRNLLDCFTSLHSTSCDICIDEARLAGRLHRQGKTVEEIRAAIIQRQWANLGSPK